MISGFLRAVDALSLAVFRASFLFVLGMIAAIGYEVFSRYVLGHPTAWAFDITYMFNGAILMFAVAWTLREGGHVRVDVLDGWLGPRVRRSRDAIFFILFCCPVLSTLAWFAIRRAMRSYETGELEVVSPWKPLIWPFQSALALGLALLALQCLAEGIRQLRKEPPPTSPSSLPEVR